MKLLALAGTILLSSMLCVGPVSAAPELVKPRGSASPQDLTAKRGSHTVKDLATPLGTAKDLATPLPNAKDLATPLGTAKDLATPLPNAKDLATPLGTARDLAAPLPDAKDLAIPLGLARDLAAPLGWKFAKDLASPLSSAVSDLAARRDSMGSPSSIIEAVAPPVLPPSTVQPASPVPLAKHTSSEPAPGPVKAPGQQMFVPDPELSSTPLSTPISNAISTPISTPDSTPISTPVSIPISTPDPAGAAAPQEAATAPNTPESAGLQSLEERLFNRSYASENNDERLSRLENFVFGSDAKGEFNTRLAKLNKILGKAERRNPAAAATPAITAQAKPKGVLAIINQGIDNYNRHRFHNAEDDFNDALDLAPGMSRIYVYLGVTLLQLNHRTAALDAMNAAYELEPFGTYGRYAKHCLIVLMGDEEVRKRGPKDDLNIVKGTIDKVNRNADADASRHNNTGQSDAAFKHKAATPFADSLTRDNGGSYVNEMALKSSFVRADAQIQATRARDDATRRAAATQESANNLKSLITAKLLPGDAKLRAFGTTLNARYYGDDTYNLAPSYIPREMPKELRAQAVTMKSLKASKSAVPKSSNKKNKSRH